MQIVIDIDEGLYEWIHRQIAVDEGWSEIQATIMDGTPLPKGHGRLIDADDLDITTITTDDYSGNEVLDIVLKEDVETADTIIEADREVQE